MSVKAPVTLHRFLQFDSLKPLTSEVSEIAAYVLNRFTGERRSVSYYRKHDPLTLTHDQRHVAFRFRDLVGHMQVSRSLDASKFDFPKVLSDWLDSGVAISKPDAPIPATDGSHFLEFCVPLPLAIPSR